MVELTLGYLVSISKRVFQQTLVEVIMERQIQDKCMQLLKVVLQLYVS